MNNNTTAIAPPRRSFSMNNYDLINMIHANHLIGFAPPPPPSLPYYSSYPPAAAAAPPLLPLPVSRPPRHTSLPNYQTTQRKPANRPRKHKTKPVINRPDQPKPGSAGPVGPKGSSYPAGKEIPVISLAADDLFISLLSPPPSSLPLPKFFMGRPKRAQQQMMRSCTVEAAAGGNDDVSVDNLRRLLRLP
ncbi:hypothetical protein LINPERHAP1_LOCUS30832 [Linum perenne]